MAHRLTLTRRDAFRAALPAVQRLPWPAGWSISRWAAIRVVQCVRRRAFVAFTAFGLRMGEYHSRAHVPSLRASILAAGSRAIPYYWSELDACCWATPLTKDHENC